MRARALAIPIAAFAAMVLWMATGEGPRPPEPFVPAPPARVQADDDPEEARVPGPPAPATPMVVDAPSVADLEDDRAPGTATITGVVYDISTPSSAGARPLRNARVIASLPRPREVAETIETRTDREGRFSLDIPVPSTVSLSIERDDFVPYELPSMLFLAPEIRDLGRINLPRRGRVLGRVVDERGLAVGSARILLGDRMITEADKDGSFEIRGLPWGILSLRAEREGYFSVTGPELEVRYRINEELRGVVLHLGNHRGIFGVVMDESGNPIDGAEVTAAARINRVVEDGGYEVQGMFNFFEPENWRLYYDLAGPYPGGGAVGSARGMEDDLARWHTEQAKTLSSWFLSEVAKRTDPWDSSVTVVERSWLIPPQTFHSESEARSFSATSDATGRFAITGELRDCAYDLTVTRAGYKLAEIQVEGPGTEAHEIRLVQEPWLTFTVRGRGGAALDPSWVEIRSAVPSDDWYPAEFWSKGRDWFVGCPEPGRWQVRVKATGHTFEESPLAGVRNGEVQSVGRLSLDPYRDEVFRVVSQEDGEPIEGATLTTWYEGVRLERRSNAKGEFRVPVRSYAVVWREGSRMGRWRFAKGEATKRIRSEVWTTVRVTAEGFVPYEGDPEVFYELRRAARIEGTVFGFDDQPVAGVPVGFFSDERTGTGLGSYQGNFEMPTGAISDESGRYQIEGLDPGSGTVVVGAAMPRSREELAILAHMAYIAGVSAEAKLGASEPLDLEFAKLYGDVAGRVVIRGEPAAGLEVHVRLSRFPSVSLTHVGTGLDGTFAFPPLLPATYELEIRREGVTYYVTPPFDLSVGARPRFSIVVPFGEIRGAVRASYSAVVPKSLVLHRAEDFSAERPSSSSSLRTLVGPDRSFRLPQVSPGDYVLTGLDRGAGVVPTPVSVVADQVTSVELDVVPSATTTVRMNWEPLIVKSLVLWRQGVRFQLEDWTAGLTWAPSVTRIADDDWEVTGPVRCGPLHVLIGDRRVGAIRDPFGKPDEVHVIVVDPEEEVVEDEVAEDGAEGSGDGGP